MTFPAKRTHHGQKVYETEETKNLEPAEKAAGLFPCDYCGFRDDLCNDPACHLTGQRGFRDGG